MSKQSMVGSPVIIIGRSGRQMMALLHRYDEPSDSFDGVAFFPGTIKVKVIGGTEGVQAVLDGVTFGADTMEIVPTLPVKGLRAYPYSARPDYAFQFVRPGDDIQPLLDIASRNAGGGVPSVEEHTEAPPPEPAPSPGPRSESQPQPSTSEIHPADTNADHRISGQEKRDYEAANPGETVKKGPY